MNNLTFLGVHVLKNMFCVRSVRFFFTIIQFICFDSHRREINEIQQLHKQTDKNIFSSGNGSGVEKKKENRRDERGRAVPSSSENGAVEVSGVHSRPHQPVAFLVRLDQFLLQTVRAGQQHRDLRQGRRR